VRRETVGGVEKRCKRQRTYCGHCGTLEETWVVGKTIVDTVFDRKGVSGMELWWTLWYGYFPPVKSIFSRGPLYTIFPLCFLDLFDFCF